MAKHPELAKQAEAYTHGEIVKVTEPNGYFYYAVVNAYNILHETCISVWTAKWRNHEYGGAGYDDIDLREVHVESMNLWVPGNTYQGGRGFCLSDFAMDYVIENFADRKPMPKNLKPLTAFIHERVKIGDKVDDVLHKTGSRIGGTITNLTKRTFSFRDANGRLHKNHPLTEIISMA